MRQILFVCTGNVFRSMTAEHALRQVLADHPGVSVSSAGTLDQLCTVDPIVVAYLHSRGIDVSGHRRRTLTADMLEPEVTVIAMSTDHREFIAQRFGHDDVLLFTEACSTSTRRSPIPHRTQPRSKRTSAGRSIASWS
jgi:protein-tyrosine phosphatase